MKCPVCGATDNVRCCEFGREPAPLSTLQRWVLSLIEHSVAGMPSRTHSWAHEFIVEDYIDWFHSVAYGECACDHADCPLNVTSALRN